MSRIVDPNSAVFCAIRDGSILQKAKNFKKEDLKPFLPVLMYRTFPSYSINACFSQKTDSLDNLRACLIDCSEGNEILSFLRYNYEVLEQRFLETRRGKQQSSINNKQYSLLSLSDKLYVIGCQILNKVNAHMPNAETFEPFDAEPYQEEVVWIISFLCFFIPSLFNIAECAPLFLRYSYGKQLIIGVIMNHPQRIEQTLTKLLFAKNTDEGLCMRRKNDTIFGLLRIDPNQAEDFLGRVLEAGGRYRLAVTLLCSRLIHDKVFVNTLIQHLLQKNNQFSAFLIKNANKEMAEKMRKRFNEILQLRKHPESKERIILLLCALSTYNIIKVPMNTNESNHIWVKALTDVSVTNLRLLKIMLATILACPNVVSQNLYADSADYQQISEFFTYLRELTRKADVGLYAPLNQFMLLIAIHLKADNHAELSKLLSAELNITIGDVLRRQVQLKALFMQKAILEEDLAQKAANLGVTKGLDNEMIGYLPVHCINQLLGSRIFSKNQINIQVWIQEQLLESLLPVHQVMVQMLENFAASCFPSGEDTNYNTKIDEEFFWDIFKGEFFANDKILATRILSLFYLLAYTRRLDTTVVSGNKGRPIPRGYSDALWAEIPIRYILSVMDARPKDFELIRPSLLHYVGSSIPHMLPTLDASLDKTEDELGKKIRSLKISIDKDEFFEAVNKMKENITRFTTLLRTIELASIQEQYKHYESMIRALTVTLDGEFCPMILTRKLAKIWKRLENLIPRKLYEKTLDLWLNSSRSAGKGFVRITNSLLLKETPLIMFRVDDRIFRSPPHFELLLRMLSFYLDSVKNANLVRLTKAATISETRSEIDERHQLFKGFTGTQHLAVVQVLLEICDGDEKQESVLSEIRDLACAQIHQMFVSDPALPKLVHFNMYPLRLIPMVVDKVPSAHVLLAELHELVHQSHIQRRIFAINLISELAKKYTIPMSLAGLEFMEDVLTTLINSKIDESAIALFSNIIPALKTFISLSPMHSESVKSTLKRLRTISKSRLSLYTTNYMSGKCVEKVLIGYIDSVLQS